MEKKVERCPVCSGVEKLMYTAVRYGPKEGYLRQLTYSGVAKNCPECGKKLRD